MTASPNASRFASVQPPFRWYGAYWTKMLITCLPGGAMPGSIMDGMTMSMYGLRENSPYFASSYARSRYSTLGLMETAPRSAFARSGDRYPPCLAEAGEVRQRVEREVHLA